MQKPIADKMIHDSENKAQVNLVAFNFPAYQITVMASSQEEAEQKLEKILQEKEINNTK